MENHQLLKQVRKDVAKHMIWMWTMLPIVCAICLIIVALFWADSIKRHLDGFNHILGYIVLILIVSLPVMMLWGYFSTGKHMDYIKEKKKASECIIDIYESTSIMVANLVNAVTIYSTQQAIVSKVDRDQYWSKFKAVGLASIEEMIEEGRRDHEDFSGKFQEAKAIIIANVENVLSGVIDYAEKQVLSHLVGSQQPGDVLTENFERRCRSVAAFNEKFIQSYEHVFKEKAAKERQNIVQLEGVCGLLGASY